MCCLVAYDCHIQNTRPKVTGHMVWSAGRPCATAGGLFYSWAILAKKAKLQTNWLRAYYTGRDTAERRKAWRLDQLSVRDYVHLGRFLRGDIASSARLFIVIPYSLFLSIVWSNIESSYYVIHANLNCI